MYCEREQLSRYKATDDCQLFHRYSMALYSTERRLVTEDILSRGLFLSNWPWIRSYRNLVKSKPFTIVKEMETIPSMVYKIIYNG